MTFQFNIRAVIAFFVLGFLLHEAHEFSHYLVASTMCGCWAQRDFLYFQLCGECHPPYGLIFYNLAGPAMTYLFIWIGYFLLKSSNTDEKKIWGFALVMAALPLSRLLAVIGHGGNEITAMRMIFASDQPFKGIPVIVGGILVLSLLIAPLWRAYRSIRNKHSWLIFLAFLVVPWQIDELIITKLLNGYVVSSGFLMHPIYLGTPLLVIVWQIILIVLFLITKKQIQCFLVGKCS